MAELHARETKEGDIVVCIHGTKQPESIGGIVEFKKYRVETRNVVYNYLCVDLSRAWSAWRFAKVPPINE